MTANVEHIVTLAENEDFRNAYRAACARTLDGAPLVHLARLRGAGRVARITGHDLLAAVFARAGDAAAAPEKVFMVCARVETGSAMIERFAACGITPASVDFAVPPFGFERDPAASRRLAERIRRHGTTLLVMGVGAPKSEVWVHRQGDALGNPVVLNVGEALNVAAGLVPRAPVWMQRLSLEWLFRFANDPRRLFHRYFVRSWSFIGLALRNADIGGPGVPPPGD